MCARQQDTPPVSGGCRTEADEALLLLAETILAAFESREEWREGYEAFRRQSNSQGGTSRLNGFFSRALRQLPDAVAEALEERAGIMEFHGGLTRLEAEYFALKEKELV